MIRTGLSGLGATVTAGAVILGITLLGGHSTGPNTTSTNVVINPAVSMINQRQAAAESSPTAPPVTTIPEYFKTAVALQRTALAAARHTLVESAPVARPTPAPTPGPIVPPSGAGACPGLGLFVAGENPASITSLASQLGVNVGMMTVYANQPSYTQFTPPSTSMRLLLGVGEVTPAEATTIGDTLVASGHANTMIRIMWEMNGNWFPWGTQSLSAAQYISIYQAAEQAFAAVPGNQFQYVWNVNAGTAEPGRTEFDTYPGSAYVSNIGIDYYDGNATAGQISAIVAFAQSQGKSLSFDEWGVNGKDDPAYIDYISSIAHDPADDVTAEAYFSDGNSTLTDYPAAAAEYTKDFSGSC